MNPEINFGRTANALKSQAADHILCITEDVFDPGMGDYQNNINKSLAPLLLKGLIPRYVTVSEIKSGTVKYNCNIVITTDEAYHLLSPQPMDILYLCIGAEGKIETAYFGGVSIDFNTDTIQQNTERIVALENRLTDLENLDQTMLDPIISHIEQVETRVDNVEDNFDRKIDEMDDRYDRLITTTEDNLQRQIDNLSDVVDSNESAITKETDEIWNFAEGLEREIDRLDAIDGETFIGIANNVEEFKALGASAGTTGWGYVATSSTQSAKTMALYFYTGTAAIRIGTDTYDLTDFQSIWEKYQEVCDLWEVLTETQYEQEGHKTANKFYYVVEDEDEEETEP